MPKISNRKKVLETILLKGCFELISANSLSEVDEAFHQCSESFLRVLKYRYSGTKITCVPKSTEWYMKILPSYDDDRFKSCMRVTRSTFGLILNIVRETPPFTSLKSPKMKPVEFQLAIALYRFGNDGSGTSFHRVAEHFGASEAGMIQSSTERIIKALLSVQHQFITWPNEIERKRICMTMEDSLPGCIGYMDGTHVPLFEAPAEDHEAYFSRKQQYALHVHAICDNDLMFRSVSLGYPASAHDARVFANSPIGLHPENFLSNGEWIAGDSAYRSTRYVVTPFRENSNVGTRAERRSFNRHFSSKRVKIEHSFGILKMVFASLRSLRIRVDKNKGHRRACDWIMACMILYNIIKPTPEDYDATVDATVQNEMDSQEQATTNEDTLQRDILFDWFLRTVF